MKKLSMFLATILTTYQAMASYSMPVQGNKYAAEVDSLYGFLLYVSLISCIMVIGGMIYFVLRYKRKTANDDTPYISHNNTLEFLWSFIPFVIFIFVFAWGWKLFHEARNAPENAFEIHTFGRQWGWDFQYKSGRTSTNEFVVPVGKPIKLIMTSSDVLHSFFIPAFRVKQDVVPGMYTSLWFEADKEGEFQVYCTEYCGADHSRMLAKLTVLSQKGFEKWLADDPMKKFEGMDLASRGKIIVGEKACTACHSFTDSTVKIGPSLHNVFGQKRTFTDGTEGVLDAAYIRESIKKPQAKKSVGYENGVMSLIPITEQEITWITEYLKSTTK